jgi:putative hemolysin
MRAFPARLFEFFAARGAEAETLGRSGSLEVRLARSAVDVRRAQKLRWNVFYGEMAARPDWRSSLLRRDVDAFDAICDHLLVVDAARSDDRGRPAVVGTYRLLRQEIAERHGGFYTASEFEIGPMIARHPGLRFLELGRSCVEKAYRDKRTVELLWHGIWAYVRRHRIDVMFGCASFEGTDAEALALPLGFLHANALADDEWRAAALPARRVGTDAAVPARIDAKKAMQALPPLMKGYLRLGARFGEGAVIDDRFGTIDVLVVLPVKDIHPKYVGYFGSEGDRYAA